MPLGEDAVIPHWGPDWEPSAGLIYGTSIASHFLLQDGHVEVEVTVPLVVILRVGVGGGDFSFVLFDW